MKNKTQAWKSQVYSLGLFRISYPLIDVSYYQYYAGGMRAADYLYSQLASLERRASRPGLKPDSLIEEARRLFHGNVSATVGETISYELFQWWLQRYGEKLEIGMLGQFAAFLTEGRDPSQNFDSEDLEAIKDAVDAEAAELDLNVLSRIMSDLLELGALD